MPKKKPVLVEKKDLSENDEKKKLTTVKKKVNGVILPLPKPIVVSKVKPPKKSKFYSKKDVARAKKAISLMEKAKWYDALKEAWKAKDKSIYNFIQWKHLLTTGNQATFNLLSRLASILTSGKDKNLPRTSTSFCFVFTK